MNGRYRTIFVLLGLLLLTSACSAKQVYNFGSDVGRGIADCEAKRSATVRSECEQGRDISYDGYKRQRDDLKPKD